MTNELVDLMDEKGNELGIKKMKSKVHRDGDWHKGAHVWILKDNKVLLQRRSKRKQFLPDKFDVSCGGHVMSGETFEECLVRELKEELGISVKKEDIIFLEKRRQITVDKAKKLISREILGVFMLKTDIDLDKIKINRGEISEIRLFEIDELRGLIKNKPELFVDDRKYFLEIIDMLEKNIKK